MGLKVPILAVLVAATAAAAPTMPVVNIEVERDALGHSFFLQAGAAEAEPGGLVVPAGAGPEWTGLGLKPGDVIRYRDGSPAAEHIIVADGMTVFDIVRNGKPMLVRVIVHGSPFEQSTLKETDYHDVVKRISNGDPHSTPVTSNGKPSGVRITDSLLSFDLELSVGDLVRTIDGKPITTDAELVNAIRAIPVGKTTIAIERFGRPVTIEITRVASADFSTIKRISSAKFEVPRAIVDAIDNDPQLVVQKVETTPFVQGGEVRGVRLYKLEQDSLCAALGLQNDDVILDVDGKSVATFADAIDTARALSHTQNITVNVQRKNRRMAILYTIK